MKAEDVAQRAGRRCQRHGPGGRGCRSRHRPRTSRP
jgi:hypothetical protein